MVLSPRCRRYANGAAQIQPFERQWLLVVTFLNMQALDVVICQGFNNNESKRQHLPLHDLRETQLVMPVSEDDPARAAGDRHGITTARHGTSTARLDGGGGDGAGLGEGTDVGRDGATGVVAAVRVGG